MTEIFEQRPAGAGGVMEMIEQRPAGAGRMMEKRKMQTEMQAVNEDRTAAKESLRVRDYIFYFLCYSALFAVVAAAVFVWFWLKKSVSSGRRTG